MTRRQVQNLQGKHLKCNEAIPNFAQCFFFALENIFHLTIFTRSETKPIIVFRKNLKWYDF